VLHEHAGPLGGDGVQVIRDPSRSASASAVSARAKPTSNSVPWLPTRWISSGSRESAAWSCNERPEITATLVSLSAASARSAATDSRRGRASPGTSTIGASVPS
jgi:hypothetical protein